MNFWLIACINLLGISAIVGLTYLMIWLISKRKESFKLQPNGMLLGALISFSVSLATITTGITSAIPADFLWKLVIIISCLLIASTTTVVFIILLAFFN